jgi:septal ring factor EnvC (AmiA/AmiB activator)
VLLSPFHLFASPFKLITEEMLRDISKNNAEQAALSEEYKKQHKKYTMEVDALNETIRQIEKYSEEVKSEIAVTRRATYKAEQTMQVLEQQKEGQGRWLWINRNFAAMFLDCTTIAQRLRRNCAAIKQLLRKGD